MDYITFNMVSVITTTDCLPTANYSHYHS